MLQRVRTVPDDYRSFQNLPVTRYAVGPADEMIAVHVSGRLGVDRIPLVCVPGYQRNMSDFADFANHFHRAYGADWPVLLIDLKGRGRSSDRNDKSRYITTVDARDVIQILAALAVDFCVQANTVFGQRALYMLAPQIRNRLNGLYIATFFLGGALGSAVASPLHEAFGWPAIVAAGLAFPAMSFLYFLTEPREKA